MPKGTFFTPEDVPDFGDDDDSMLEAHVTKMKDTEDNLKAFLHYFSTLQPGTIIPPCPFQDWLHPDLKNHYTCIPDGLPCGWLQMIVPRTIQQ
jgi:hypothetical protein